MQLCTLIFLTLLDRKFNGILLMLHIILFIIAISTYSFKKKEHKKAGQLILS
ncbi:hypothetical protein [Jeotgalibacillus proteolyticus]|uniref:hypothetical protein n=1 Tax=Jeotgalibacillus proteolyticus TaxID=2082395 RepID=UPI0014306418|nr:hypothetical protein [Jeotgalibacillus proteolyticus]